MEGEAQPAWPPPRGFSAERAPLAVERAVTIGRAAGLDVTGGEVIAEGTNMLVRLEPEPALARMSHLGDLMRPGGAWPWFVREVELARYLAEVGLRAPRPLAAATRDEEGVSVSLWEWLDHDPYPRPSETELARSLAQLHHALAGYTGRLPAIRDVLGEIGGLCRVVRREPRLAGAAAAFERELAHVLDDLDGRGRGRAQALHGDAHSANLVQADGALVWLDLEDGCRGPVEYDLACLLAHGLPRDHDDRAVLAAYPDPLDRELLDVMLDARFLQLAVWSALLMTEQPDDRRCIERVDRWLATHADRR